MLSPSDAFFSGLQRFYQSHSKPLRSPSNIESDGAAFGDEVYSRHASTDRRSHNGDERKLEADFPAAIGANNPAATGAVEIGDDPVIKIAIGLAVVSGFVHEGSCSA
jgi:hypothetical protein